MTALPPESTLDAIRREIDSIDDQMLVLLERRFAAIRRVKATKASDGSIASSPFRPAREAAMLRRLVAKGESALSPDLLVQLWRVILSASTQYQAHVTLHVDEVMGNDLDNRLRIDQHFRGMPMEVHKSSSLALDALRSSQGDLAVMGIESDWAQGFFMTEKGSPRVIGTLPVVSRSRLPLLLILGYAEPQESGDDETLVLSPGDPLKTPSALWQAASGRFTLTSLPGFLDSEHDLVRELIARQPGARIAGRCPRPIRIST
jgi:chorismate mutase